MKTLVLLLIFITGGIAYGQKSEETIEIKTSAVCGTCEKRIEHDMKFEKGVNSVDLDLKSNVVTIKYNPWKTTPDKLKKALTDIGYAADDMPPNEKAFKKLPACCQKEGVCEH